MSTRSRIGILHEDGTTETIYCHSDGYPEHQMPILTGHYNSIEQVEELIDLGDLSILKERLAPDEGEMHGFAPVHRAENVTVAYHRDRKEPMSPAVTHKSIVSLMRDNWGIPYYYLFDEQKGHWLPPTE